jgi:hypothetical protein
MCESPRPCSSSLPTVSCLPQSSSTTHRLMPSRAIRVMSAARHTSGLSPRRRLARHRRPGCGEYRVPLTREPSSRNRTGAATVEKMARPQFHCLLCGVSHHLLLGRARLNNLRRRVRSIPARLEIHCFRWKDSYLRPFVAELATRCLVTQGNWFVASVR